MVMSTLSHSDQKYSFWTNLVWTNLNMVNSMEICICSVLDRNYTFRENVVLKFEIVDFLALILSDKHLQNAGTFALHYKLQEKFKTTHLVNSKYL